MVFSITSHLLGETYPAPSITVARPVEMMMSKSLSNLNKYIECSHYNLLRVQDHLVLHPLPNSTAIPRRLRYWLVLAWLFQAISVSESRLWGLRIFYRRRRTLYLIQLHSCVKLAVAEKKSFWRAASKKSMILAYIYMWYKTIWSICHGRFKSHWYYQVFLTLYRERFGSQIYINCSWTSKEK